MISCELAKELKEAGFKMDEVIIPGEIKDMAVVGVFKIGDVLWKFPTLPELIGALGSKFYALKQLNDGWFAAIKETAPTPEEAVAKLYLALNKK